jgi:hypothetical protein
VQCRGRDSSEPDNCEIIINTGHLSKVHQNKSQCNLHGIAVVLELQREGQSIKVGWWLAHPSIFLAFGQPPCAVIVVTH